MAQKKGYFRAEGYEVELIPMAVGLAVKTLLAGEVGATAAGTVVANLQGAKVRLVMRFIRELPYDLVVVPEIKRVEDLRGEGCRRRPRQRDFLRGARDPARARYGARPGRALAAVSL